MRNAWHIPYIIRTCFLLKSTTIPSTFLSTSTTIPSTFLTTSLTIPSLFLMTSTTIPSTFFTTSTSIPSMVMIILVFMTSHNNCIYFIGLIDLKDQVIRNEFWWFIIYTSPTNRNIFQLDTWHYLAYYKEVCSGLGSCSQVLRVKQHFLVYNLYL